MNDLEIYLDMNVYLKIAKQESHYQYLLSQLNNLKKSNVIFPHSPAHGEEVAENLFKPINTKLYQFVCTLVTRFNRGYGYLPSPPDNDTLDKRIRELTDVNDPRLRHLIQILKKIKTYGTRPNTEGVLLIEEQLVECIKRVINNDGLAVTSFAKALDVFHMGRRNKQSLESNFFRLGQEISDIEVFEEIQKKYKLDPKRLANIPPDELFKDNNFFTFAKDKLRDAGLDITQLKKSASRSPSFTEMSERIHLLLNCVEAAGYYQDKKNHAGALGTRTHDVSHAIYASRARFLITDDFRMAKKVAAVYAFLEVPTKVLNTSDFLMINTRDIISMTSCQLTTANEGASIPLA